MPRPSEKRPYRPPLFASSQLSSKHCHKCTKEFSCKRAADVHSAKCNGLLTHQCGKCLLVYPTLYAFKNHACQEQAYYGEYPNRARVFQTTRAVPVQAVQAPPAPSIGFLSPEAFALVKAYILANPERLVAAYELDVEKRGTGYVLQELTSITFFTGPIETRSLITFQYSNTRIKDSGIEVMIPRSKLLELSLQFCKDLGTDGDIVEGIARRDTATIILRARDAKKLDERNIMISVLQAKGQVFARAAVTRRVEQSRLLASAQESHEGAEAESVPEIKPDSEPQPSPSLDDMVLTLKDTVRAHPAVKQVIDIRHDSLADALVAMLVQYTYYGDQWFSAHEASSGCLEWQVCEDPTTLVEETAHQVFRRLRDVLLADRYADDEVEEEEAATRRRAHYLVDSASFDIKFKAAVVKSFHARNSCKAAT